MTKLWGGRFKKKINPLFEEFSKSIHYDYKLAQYDLVGSLIHVEVLKSSGYLTLPEAAKLNQVIDSLWKLVKKKKFKQSDKYEDIHTYVQNELQNKVGDLALKLHMARSRNDQVVFATKLYCKVEISKMQTKVLKLAKTITELALKAKKENIIIPGFTHMQHAQPVYLADYLLVYVNMLTRDSDRLGHIKENIKITMGAGALAGTPIDANKYSEEASKALKEFGDFQETFDIKPVDNSLDSVSDRDFVIEIISTLSIVAMHLSRLAEDLIIWSTQEFGFVEIDEAYCSGSSLMPQKKNADSLELIRGNTGRIYGNLVSVLTMMKGLPLTYNRDMQLDKEPLFNSFEIMSKELEVLTGLIKTLEFNNTKIGKALEDESLYATDIVYYLVDKEVPFKEAHTIVGKLVRYSIDNNIEIKKLPKDKLKQFSDKFVMDEIVELFDPKKSVESKKSIKREQN